MESNLNRNSGEENECKALLDIATPELYLNNAFRILGVPVNITASELAKHEKKLKLIEKLGISNENLDRGLLPLNPPPDLDAIRKATHRLHNPEARLIDGLFWFWFEENGNQQNDILKTLKDKGAEYAFGEWNDFEEKGNKNIILKHNLAVLSHAMALDLEFSEENANASLRNYYWETAYRCWHYLYGNEIFWGKVTTMIREFDDPRLTTGFARRIRSSFPKSILTINVKLAIQSAKAKHDDITSLHLRCIQNSPFSPAITADAIEHEIEPFLELIKMLCDSVPEKAKANPDKAYELAEQIIADLQLALYIISTLIRSTINQPRLLQLGSFAYDKVAEEIRNCAIAFGNKTNDWGKCLVLIKKAEQLVHSDELRTRLDNDLAQVEKNNNEQQELTNLKESIYTDETFNVTVIGSGIIVPQVCVCCLGQSDSSTSLSYSWEERKAFTRCQRTISFQFPFCSKCEEHQKEYTKKMWEIFFSTLGSSTLIVFILGLCIGGMSFTPLFGQFLV